MTFFLDTKMARSHQSHLGASLEAASSLPPVPNIFAANVGRSCAPSHQLHQQPRAYVCNRPPSCAPPVPSRNRHPLAAQPIHVPSLSASPGPATQQLRARPLQTGFTSIRLRARPRGPPRSARAPARKFDVPFPFAPISIEGMGRQGRIQRGARGATLEDSASTDGTPLAGDYVCHHEDCCRRFVRKTALTNHLKAHLNVKSRSIYRTKRARMRAAAAAELKTHQPQDADLPQPFLPPPVPRQGGYETLEDRFEPFSSHFSIHESGVASDVTAAKLESTHHQFQGPPAPTFVAQKDHQFASGISYQLHHEQQQHSSAVVRPGLACPAAEMLYTCARNGDLACRSQVGPTSPVTFENNCPSQTEAVSYSGEIRSAQPGPSDQLSLGLDLNVGGGEINDSWLYSTSSLESVGACEYSGGQMSTNAVSSECEGPGETVDINFANRADCHRDIPSTESAGSMFGRDCSRSEPIGHLAPCSGGEGLFSHEKRPVSETVGSPVDDIFGESLMVPFDSFSCL